MVSHRNVGVLALQGGVAEHARMVESLGHRTRLVRRSTDLPGLEALILPGGESTTLTRLLKAFDLTEALQEAVNRLPVLGTCAGLILLSRLGVLDVDVERNAFGSQVDSVTAQLPWRDGLVSAAFIRAPRVSRVGEGVEVCSTWHDPRRPEAECSVVGVAVKRECGQAIGISFHPELTGDTTIHQELLA